jgi:hypothetical protein
MKGNERHGHDPDKIGTANSAPKAFSGAYVWFRLPQFSRQNDAPDASIRR